MKSRVKQRGYLMIAAVIIIVIIGFIGVAVAYLFTSNSRAGVDQLRSAQAFYLAASAVERLKHVWAGPNAAGPAVCAGTTFTDTTALNPPGSYQVISTQAVYRTAPTALSSAITASSTTIPVASTAGYNPIMGVIMIDRELITYHGLTATGFLNALRGAGGTAAVAHVSGTLVGQYQCNATLRGNAPGGTPASPGDSYGQRTLQANGVIHLQEAWAVGNSTGTVANFARWNYPTEGQGSTVTATGAVNLQSISMLSYADGWAVGAGSRIFHWTGTNWVDQGAQGPNTDYMQIFCRSKNNCIAVGLVQGPNPVIVYWNGSTWTRQTPTGASSRTSLYGLHCSTDTDCWTAGTNNGGGIFYRGSATSWQGFTQAALTAYPYNGVFCNSPTDCWAVGANRTFARLTAGTTWRNCSAGENCTALSIAQYNSIFCNSSTDCVAVGNAVGGNVTIARWNGTQWSNQLPSPAVNANLKSVSCSRSRDCWAVGVSATSTTPVFLRWNGSTWTQFTISGFPAISVNSISIVGAGVGFPPQTMWQESFA